MKKNTSKSKAIDCSIARSLGEIGDRWVFLILREAFFGVRQFEQFQRNLGIATNILSGRLRTLVDANIFGKHLYQTSPDRYEYRLTEKGLDLYPVIVTLIRWGDRWLGREDGPPLLLHHEPCGERLTGSFVCEHCGVEIRAQDVRYDAGPGAGGNGDRNN